VLAMVVMAVIRTSFNVVLARELEGEMRFEPDQQHNGAQP
jgi:hypothetical protein